MASISNTWFSRKSPRIQPSFKSGVLVPSPDPHIYSRNSHVDYNARTVFLLSCVFYIIIVQFKQQIIDWFIKPLSRFFDWWFSF